MEEIVGTQNSSGNLTIIHSCWTEGHVFNSFAVVVVVVVVIIIIVVVVIVIVVIIIVVVVVVIIVIVRTGAAAFVAHGQVPSKRIDKEIKPDGQMPMVI